MSEFEKSIIFFIIALLLIIIITFNIKRNSKKNKESESFMEAVLVIKRILKNNESKGDSYSREDKNYELTFRFNNGEEKSFYVDEDTYNQNSIHEKGILTFKNFIFINFEKK